ncbi:MBL fold metallo-hydrolase [Zhongshania sp. BJYM1]|uniref:MBL fold metallo-hydrolase n=1 Tax=Zhongshania aquatica TaxID=2965069 RepID=UPI0022B4193A|nr:MBL fold metallo-hydrolase [Marortus sp. BJYM1]
MTNKLIALFCIITLSGCLPSGLTSRVMEIGIEKRMSANTVDELDDGLHFALCGAGGPMPAPKASGPCSVVIAGKRIFVVDAGSDGVRNIMRMGYPVGKIEAVFLTHFHSDHLDGLGEMGTLRWAGGANKNPLPVFGPEGISNVVDGFNMAYSHDAAYRHAHHGDVVAPLSGAGLIAHAFEKPAQGELTVLLKDEDLTIEALAVNHAPVDPAVAYRFTYKDRSLLITGDTVKSANIQQFAKGVDLLIHEALAPNLVMLMNKVAKKTDNTIADHITHDILDYHASPVEAAETARDAGVGHLIYYHIVPPLVMPGQKALYLNGADKIFKNYTIGEDGVAFSLPAGSKEIIQTSDSL